MRKKWVQGFLATAVAGAVLLGGSITANAATWNTSSTTSSSSEAKTSVVANTAALKTSAGGGRCTTAKKPAHQVTNYYTNPKKHTSAAAAGVAATICAAAPNSTINAAVYFFSDQSEASKIIDALVYVHNKKHVKINLVYDKRPKSSDYYTPTSLVKRLKQIGTVHSCEYGCRSAKTGYATLHVKFLTISKMTWAGKKPAVIDMSANWDNRQFDEYWQMVNVVYGNQALTSAYKTRFASYVKCAKTNKKCTGVPNSKRSSLGTLVDKNPSQTVHAGDKGTGLSVFFAPLELGNDPVSAKLQNLVDTKACADGGNIKLSMFYFTQERGLNVAKLLAKLSKQGCVVKIVLSGPTGGGDYTSKNIRKVMDKAGIQEHCTALNHMKLWLFNVKGYKAFWAGSSNVGAADVISNDESQLFGVVNNATGKYKKGLNKTIAEMTRQFNTAYSAKHSTCNI